MIEIVAHADNDWPGAYRLHMKDTGFLLGVGRDVKATAAARLLEEGMRGTFHVAFADGGPGLRADTGYDVQVDVTYTPEPEGLSETFTARVETEPEPAPAKPKKAATKKKR